MKQYYVVFFGNAMRFTGVTCESKKDAIQHTFGFSDRAMWAFALGGNKRKALRAFRSYIDRSRPRVIQITIEARNNFCGTCHCGFSVSYWCDAFEQSLASCDGQPLRCRKCLKAEK